MNEEMEGPGPTMEAPAAGELADLEVLSCQCLIAKSLNLTCIHLFPGFDEQTTLYLVFDPGQFRNRAGLDAIEDLDEMESTVGLDRPGNLTCRRTNECRP